MHTAATILKKYKWTSEEKPRAEASKERAELAAEVKSLRDWLKQCKEGDAHKPELDAALSLLKLGITQFEVYILSSAKFDLIMQSSAVISEHALFTELPIQRALPT